MRGLTTGNMTRHSHDRTAHGWGTESAAHGGRLPVYPIDIEPSSPGPWQLPLRSHPGCGEHEVNPATTGAVVRGLLGPRCGARGKRTREVLRCSLGYPGCDCCLCCS